jgi:coenzyme F420-reducing hydrogenase delta subunit
MSECLYSTSYILLIKTVKKIVKILEEMFVEKEREKFPRFFANQKRSYVIYIL